MDELEKLLSRQKKLAQKVTGQVARTARKGVQAVQKGLESLDLPEKQAGPLVSLTPAMGKHQQELRALYNRQMDADLLLQKNRGKLISCKQLETINEYSRKQDEAVYRAYFKSGGIRFHAQTLLEHLELLDPEQDDVKTMVVRCYNSAISYMLRDFHKLMEEWDGWNGKLEQVKNMYLDEGALCRALGYTSCGPRLQKLKAASGEELATTLPEMRAAVQKNEEAVSGYLARCEETLRPYEKQNSPLLEDLCRLLSDGATGKFASIEGWTPEGYYRDVVFYAEYIRKKLLDTYLLPGELPREKESSVRREQP